jgi:hypothetical protein
MNTDRQLLRVHRKSEDASPQTAFMHDISQPSIIPRWLKDRVFAENACAGKMSTSAGKASTCGHELKLLIVHMRRAKPSRQLLTRVDELGGYTLVAAHVLVQLWHALSTRESLGELLGLRCLLHDTSLLKVLHNRKGVNMCTLGKGSWYTCR